MMQDLWVFGYGSLMWRPGFSFKTRRSARLHGLHRSLCVYSHVHRGTRDRPGLVLGLDTGGSCVGAAFLVERAFVPETLAYLRQREQVTMVYLETTRLVHIEGEPGQAPALCYQVDRSHAQYAGQPELQEQVRLVCQGHGQSGPNIDYLHQTLRHLRKLGIHDHRLEQLDAAVNAAADK